MSHEHHDTLHGHHVEIKPEQFVFSPKAKKFSIALVVIGLVLTIAGIFTIPRDNGHHEAGNHATEAHGSHDGASHDAEHKQVQHATAAGAEIHAGDSAHGAAAAPAHHEVSMGAHEHGQTLAGIDTLHSNEQLHPVESHPKPWYTRIWATLLVNGYFLLLISACSVFFCALQYIANAGWATAIIRIPQAMLTFLPVAIILVAIAFFAGKGDLYHWVEYQSHHLQKGDAGFDKILDNKSWFLNVPFVSTCVILIPLIWYLFGRKLRSLSAREDAEGAEYKNKKSPFYLKSVRFSAAFTIFFGFTLSMLSWMLIMSVDAHWFSTIFSIYNFATGWVSTLTIICFFVLFLKSSGYLSIVSDEHIHDLGKFMFAFSIFWTYLWLSQFLLIWYANIPEESIYYYHRWEMPWKVYWFANLVMNFLTPFLVLMTRNNKRNPKILMVVGTILLLGHWNDVFLMVMPGSIDKQAGIGFLEIGMTLMLAGVFIYWVLTALTKRSLIPVNHPYIEESAHHDVGV